MPDSIMDSRTDMMFNSSDEVMLMEGSLTYNARGKPHRSAKHGGYQQAELVGVGLTKQLGL